MDLLNLELVLQTSAHSLHSFKYLNNPLHGKGKKVSEEEGAIWKIT